MKYSVAIVAIDRLGHLALSGRLQRYGSGIEQVHSVEFGFQFNPDLLPKIARNFEAIAGEICDSR
ncbi:MAG: hypothetical protein HC895_20355 [Leptolyngbyaceae cyanobacterium SM1_3_5]|nr:hypothetical protein [Leptolyngbyaceae cyanobacterium SM1_3_5]